METIKISSNCGYIRKVFPPAIRFLAIFITAFLLFQGNASAQFNLSTGLNASYNDNINSNYEFLSDEVSELFFETAYDFPSKNKNLQLYYEGSFDYFRRNVNRTFHNHSAGLIYSHSFGKQSTTGLNIGASYSTSINRDVYSYLDYNGASAFADFRHYVGERTLWQAGYNFNYFNYSVLSDFNNFKNEIHTSFTGFLPSRTSINIAAAFGAKTYINSLTSTTGQRKYKMANSSVFGESLLRLDISGKISQSVFEKTGVSITAGYSRNLKGSERYLTSGNLTGSGNIFDDEYSYEGPFVELSLTQRIPWDISAVLSGSYHNRNYVDRPAYDLEENIIANERIDKLFIASIQLIKHFKYFGIKLDYNYVNNSTNDEYNNFKNNVFSIELGVGF